MWFGNGKPDSVPAVSTAIPLPFARTENTQTSNASTFESEMRAGNQDQINPFFPIWYPNAEGIYFIKNTRKTHMPQDLLLGRRNQKSGR